MYYGISISEVCVILTLKDLIQLNHISSYPPVGTLLLYFKVGNFSFRNVLHPRLIILPEDGGC